jgi:hypothetical protein
MPAQAVAAWEAQGARVLENRDGLRVVELSDGASTHRIAAIDAETDQGTNVIGLVFMDETDIAEFEELEAEARLLGPSVASAHFKDQSHYHYFFNCSYAYNQGGTYGMSWYMCPEDTANDRIIGDALALALAASSKKALLKWLGGMLFAVNETYFRYYDGSYRVVPAIFV